jgi:hypothetical protein
MLMRLHCKTGKNVCFERLERKSQPIFDLLEQTNQDWEEFFILFIS